jgi:hypothetical protein
MAKKLRVPAAENQQWGQRAEQGWNQPPTAPPPGWPQGAYAPLPPAVPVKKKRRWPWVLLAIAVVIGIIIATQSGKSTSSGATGGTSTSAGVPAAARIGTPVRDGKFEFVVTKVQSGQASIGDQYLNQKAQGQFVIVSVTVTNTAGEAQEFLGSTAKAFDASGREYSPSTSAAMYLKDSNSFIEQINPGNTVSGQVVFDVPKGTTLTGLELHDSLFSDGVQVTLR